MFIGSHTDTKASNYIQYLNLAEETKQISKILHEGSVMKLRQIINDKKSLIASKSSNCDIHIYDIKQFYKHKKSNALPQLRLKGHHKIGKALEWNKLNKNLIVSGSTDCQILIWDLYDKNKNSTFLSPFNKYISNYEIYDIDCTLKKDYLFSTSGEKGNISM